MHGILAVIQTNYLMAFMLLSLSFDTRGLFKKYGKKRLFHSENSWLVLQTQPHNFLLPITVSFSSKDRKIASSRNFYCSTLWRISENWYLFPLHSIHTVLPTMLFFMPSLFTNPMTRIEVLVLQTAPNPSKTTSLACTERCLKASCSLAFSFRQSCFPSSLLPWGWVSGIHQVSQPFMISGGLLKLAACIQEQGSPPYTSFFNTSLCIEKGPVAKLNCSTLFGSARMLSHARHPPLWDIRSNWARQWAFGHPPTKPLICFTGKRLWLHR